MCRFALAFTFALGVAGARNPVETEVEKLAESADGDAETHKRDEHRATRHRGAARLLATGGRGVAIFAAPLCMAPTRCAPTLRARGVPRRTNPDDDDERRIG